MRRGLVAAALGVAGVGAALGRAEVVVLAAVPFAVLAAGALTGPATPRVTVERELSTEAPALGEAVTVRVTVTNEGATVADCLVTDALPADIDAVEDPRHSVRLPAGASTTLAYDVVARRGTHEFGPVTVTARGLVSDASLVEPVDSTLECRPEARPLQLRASVARRVGDRSADAGGSGVEFHSVREYRPSDPQRRIDWRRFARTGELTTVKFRQDSATTVHLLVDVRDVGAVRGRPAGPTALAYAVDATERLARALVERGVDVGVGLYPDAVGALPPDSGRGQRTRVAQLLASHGSLPWGEGTAVPPAGERAVADGGADDWTRPDPDSLEGGLPEALRRDARTLLVSPCLDDRPVTFATAAESRGAEVGVLAVDVGGSSPGAAVERALRAERLGRLEGAGVPVADWAVSAPLSAAVEEVFATWT